MHSEKTVVRQIEDPTKQVCRCGSDMRKVCSGCSEWRKRQILGKAGKLDPHSYIKLAPGNQNSNTLLKKNTYEVRRMMSRALGRKVTTAEFQAIHKAQIKKVEEQERQKKIKNV